MAQETEINGTSTAETDEAGTKTLVVYFSATGNTKAVAETLAGLTEADIYEIVPEQPYMDEELNYNDRSTRATAEQNDPDARPATLYWKSHKIIWKKKKRCKKE